MRYALKLALPLLTLAVLVAGCRKDEHPSNVEQEKIPGYTAPQDRATIKAPRGMYVLNNGGRGNYETTVDYIDFATGVYHHNFFAEKNTLLSLGDNGLAMKIAQQKLFVVLNGSHRVAVLCADPDDEANFGRLLGEVAVNQPSDIVIVGDYAYVTSMIRPKTAEGRRPLGEVIRFDITQFAKGAEKRIAQEDIPRADRVTVGCQPVSIVRGGTESPGEYKDYLFVANSGSLNAPEFDNTVSFISIADGGLVLRGQAEVRARPFMLMAAHGFLLVGTKGESGLDEALELQKYAIDGDRVQLTPVKVGGKTLSPRAEVVKATYNLDDLFMVKGRPSSNGAARAPRFEVVKTLPSNQEGYHRSSSKLPAAQVPIEALTALAIAPNFDRVVLDARNGTSSGRVLYFNSEGKPLWSARAGIIPMAVAFQNK
ncbi:MAG: hypothetical protein CSA07_00505 [Bacteroidia bacterium]|nr:MAG: hypothetical protein CSA07_00505 [Bacteroidia bacterium]